MPLSVWLGALSLAWHILTTIVGAIVYERGSLRKLYSLAGCVVFGTVASKCTGFTHRFLDRGRLHIRRACVALAGTEIHGYG